MYQQIIIVGNVGRDPEMRFTPQGTQVTEFSVAVNRTWTNRDGTRGENTTWYTVTCWAKLAETVYKYLKKGRQVMVIASRIEADAWNDRSTGEARAKLKVTADDVRFLGGRNDVMPVGDEMGGYSGSQGGGDYGGGGGNFVDNTEEDLPF